MRSLLALAFSLTLVGQDLTLDLDAARSRALRFASLAPAARVEALGQELTYLGLHPEPLPGGHYLVRFPGPHLGEDPDILAVPLDWPANEAAGARAAAALVEVARSLKIRRFRPKHLVWLLWSNHGTEGMEGLIQNQRDQNKTLAHVVLLEGGWEGLATTGEGRLVLNLGFEGQGPSPEEFRALLAPPDGSTPQVAPRPGGLSVSWRTADATVFQGLESLTRAAGMKAAVKSMGPQESIPPNALAGAMGHPLAVLALDHCQRFLGRAPGPVPPKPGPLALLLARGVPAVALGLGTFEGGRPVEMIGAMAEAMQDLP